MIWITLRAVLGAAAFLLVAALLGAVPSAWGVLAIPACALCAAAFCAPLAAYSVGLESDLAFPVIMRIGVLPLIPVLGNVLPDLAAARLAASRSRRCRRCGTAWSWPGTRPPAPLHFWADVVHVAGARRVHRRGTLVGPARLRPALDGMSTRLSTFRVLPPLTGRQRPWRLVERNVLGVPARMGALRSPASSSRCCSCLSIGIGVGELVGELPVGGQLVDYEEFVAPGLLAAAAMNGALLDTTFNFFIKYKYSHTYDAIVATPVGAGDIATGEVVWALMRRRDLLRPRSW